MFTSQCCSKRVSTRVHSVANRSNNTKVRAAVVMAEGARVEGARVVAVRGAVARAVTARAGAGDGWGGGGEGDGEGDSGGERLVVVSASNPLGGA